MEEIPLQYANQGIAGPKKKSPALLIFLVIFILVAIGFFIFRKTNKTIEKKETAVVTIEPSPTEKPVDKTKVKIQIQNGTGTPGQASNTAEVLKNAGYNIENIETSNVKDYKDTVTKISAKSGFEGTARDIKAVLESKFTEINIESTKLDSSDNFDIVIVTGGKLFETPTPVESLTPSKTPTKTPTDTPTPTSTSTPTPTP